METPRSPHGDRITVLYDRDCGLCTWTVAHLRRWDRRGRLRHVPLQDAAPSPDRDLAAIADRYDLPSSLHVVMPDGSVRVRGQAMLAILDALPAGWVMRPWARSPGMGSVIDRLYDAIATRRDRIGEMVARRGDGEAACEPPGRPRPAPLEA